MCHSTENLFRTRASALVRASDDFYPRDAASSAPHVTACAFNTVFLAGILHPDYDMFHSRHPAARLHAVARAVSGGPVYVSDAPGAHDFAVLKTLVLPDGRVLRARLPGRPTADCLFRDVARDGVTLLKLWNVNAWTGVVGVLHVQGSAWCRTARRFVTHDDAPPPLATVVRPRDVVGAGGEAERDWVAHVQGEARARPLVRGAGVDVALAAGGAAVVTLAPVMRDAGAGFAALGLRAMLNGGGAVADVRVERGGGAVVVRVTGGGDFLAWTGREPRAVAHADGGAPLPWTHDAATGTLTVASPPGELDWGVRVEL
jgi:raffinose synthase